MNNDAFMCFLLCQPYHRFFLFCSAEIKRLKCLNVHITWLVLIKA